jgi:hypothetical protein
VAGDHLPINWELVQRIRGLKTFAGRYMPETKAGMVTWMNRRNLFYSLVPQENQTTKLQLSFWKYLSEQTGAGMSEADATRQFVQDGQAGAAVAD